jgi:glutathionylspermidine synthase
MNCPMPTPVEPHERLARINAELLEIGADDGLCLRYFEGIAGKCVNIEGCACAQHQLGQIPLPEGQMCHLMFEARLTDLVKKIMHVRDKIERMSSAHQDLAAEEQSLSFLVSAEHQAADATRKRRRIEEVGKHEQGLYYRLQHERLLLLTRFRPVDAMQFHERINGLLDEKAALLQAMKAPRVPQPKPV